MRPILAVTLFAAVVVPSTRAQEPAHVADASPAHAIYDVAHATAARDERSAVGEALLRQLESETPSADLRATLAAFASKMPSSPRAAARLTTLGADESLDAPELERRLEALIEDLRFAPFMQAEVPVGFPAPAPVDEIVLKLYPEYRMAKTPMRTTMGTPFFALFNHIQRNEIPMTAPVQVEFDAADPRARRTTSMAFLYETRELGPAGPDAADERVEVVDLPAMTTVTIGARGYDSPARIAELRAVLEAWLAGQGGRFAPAGPLRTMGYNSPMVPAPRRFFEVELPITRAAGQPVVAK